MKIIITTLLIIFLPALNIVAQSVNIPEGVNYQTISNEKNEEAKNLIKKELSNPNYVLFDKILYCGPNIWSRYKKYPEISKIEKGNIVFKVPQADGSIIEKQGKAIQSKNDFKIWWKQVIDDFARAKYTIRKLKYEELQYHWQIIFYDIEEPIFTIENEKRQLIIDLNNKLKIIFIEEFK